MPFGSHPFQDLRAAWDRCEKSGWSPMPFGSHPFQDERRSHQRLLHLDESPMPFGSHPFQDADTVDEHKKLMQSVTNAFRQSSVSGLNH